MGMFDKDKEIGLRLDREFPPGEKAEGKWSEEFIIYAADVPEGKEVQTEIGAAQVAELEVAKLSHPDQTFVVTTIAQAVVNKAMEAEEDDFPAVVKTGWVKSKKGSNLALILQFVRPYKSDIA